MQMMAILHHIFDELADTLPDLHHSFHSAPLATELQTVTGYAHTLANGNALLITEQGQAALIMYEHVLLNKITMGDRVQAKVSNNTNSQNFLVENILKVTKIGYDTLPAVKNSRTLTLDNQHVTYGTTARIITNNHPDLISRIATVKKQLPPDVTTLILSFDGRATNFNDLVIPENLFVTKPSQTSREKLLQCLLAFFRAKELATAGKNVVLMIDSLDKMFTVFNNCMQAAGIIDPNFIATGAVTDLESILCDSKTLPQGGSLTILGFHCPGTTPPQQYITERFHQILDTVIK